MPRSPGDDNKNADTSLRSKALRRALEHDLPKTLTPHEWEQWYADHGVPQSHQQGETTARRSWWRFWKS